jgi:hypothetical protein
MWAKECWGRGPGSQGFPVEGGMQRCRMTNLLVGRSQAYCGKQAVVFHIAERYSQIDAIFCVRDCALCLVPDHPNDIAWFTATTALVPS